MESSLEVQVLECEMRLHDAGGLDSGPQHVLLRGDVIRLGYPLQVVQVAAGRAKADVRGLLSTSVTSKLASRPVIPVCRTPATAQRDASLKP